ncbi:MAG: hypothetical protein M3P04_06500 [Actinomycetota bacterium]|nr:hypothetical protein [Actinomycetota bacterium]
MDRDLTPWERALVERLAGVEHDLGPSVRDSVAHLVVTGFCGCGCPSVYLRDRRFPRGELELNEFSHGVSRQPEWGATLNIDDNGRPIHVDVELWVGEKPDPSVDEYDASGRQDLPDPASLLVTAVPTPPWLT